MRELTRNLVLILMASLWLAFPLHRAVARPSYYESIELITLDSDVVVCGVITEIRPVESPGPPASSSGFPVVQREPRSNDWFEIKIHVTETLKGPKAQEMVLHFHNLPPRSKTWKEGRTELLFSLRSEAGHQPTSYTPPILRPRSEESVIELDGSAQGVTTMDFQWLTSREDILTAARRGASVRLAGGKSPVRLRLEPPPSSAFMTTLKAMPFSGYRWVLVRVPVDARLEELGGKWAKSTSEEYRCLAPQALGQFKSDKNIALLKTLLLDDFRMLQVNERGQRTDYYLVRARARAALKKWGVAIDQPVIEE